MADGDIFKSFLRSGSVSMDAAKATIDRAKQATAQAAAPESKAGKPAAAPLDIRPREARNKPKPKHAIAAETKRGKTAKAARDTRPNAAKNQPKPTFSDAMQRRQPAPDIVERSGGKLMTPGPFSQMPGTGAEIRQAPPEPKPMRPRQKPDTPEKV